MKTTPSRSRISNLLYRSGRVVQHGLGRCQRPGSVLLFSLLLCARAAALQPPLTEYVITSPVGYRVHPMGGGTEQLHRGVDLVGPPGCDVLAAGAGVVVEHWPAPGTPTGCGGVFKGHPIFGGYVVIDHGDGTYTLYGHMARTYVRTGQHVAAGERIGRQGSTGISTGEHLHWEVVVDPLRFFDAPLGLNERGRKELLR